MMIPGLYTFEATARTSDSCSFCVQYNRAHPLYAGHFEGQPVTPGVCLIQTATELLGMAMGHPLRLIGARQVKFLQMHTPEKPLQFLLSWSKVDIQINALISVFQNDICIAKFNVQFEPS